ncbi:type II toxin-antitoxin system PemK/MazF family toxin [candidate division CSSED10-310 bacterium]|uniref:mRNA interferase n=1 Tax=candidate division CSSED10-310 bacterium TaxID=2855610 RepID=A0ABV6Z452_UNCC1
MTEVPLRGEVWLINWNPARGSEQAGFRPALIIQNNIGNEKAPTTIVAAISSSVRLYPMNVKVNPPEGGLKKPSIVKTSQILTLDKQRLGKKLGNLNKATMAKVDQAIRLSLAL